MKKIFLILAVLCLPCLINAQSSPEVGKITLSVVMPDSIEGFDILQLLRLQTKITQMVTSTGLSSSGYNNSFVIYPKFAINEFNVVESGTQDIATLNCELALFIKQVDNNVVFSTFSKLLKGNGKNKNIAIANALSKININDQSYKDFIETGKNKIVEYYETKCQDIISKSESFVKIQDFEQAIGLLMTVPDEVSCYNMIQEKTIDVYKVYQNQKCIVQLQDARIKIASKNYNAALEILSEIDPLTKCYKESQTLFKVIAAKVDDEDKKQWNYMMKIYNNEVELEKLRIAAVKDIAVAYYRNKPGITYNYIVH